MAPERLLDGLDPAQREAVLSAGAPLCVLAGAGSGKTRVLTRRIARRCVDGSADARHVLAITFTRRAARELTTRVGALGLRERVTAGTFHGIAWSLLRQRWADQGRPAPELMPSKLRLLAAVVGEVGGTSRRAPAPLADLAAEIDWSRARRVTPDAYETEARHAGRRPGIPLDHVAAVYRAYEASKRKRRVVDFDDLLALSAGEIARDASYAEAVRWRFRHLFVDEFQDVNPLQIEWLEAVRGGRDDLCVVGDPNQAIYGWNGADPTMLEAFAERWAGATIVRLGGNYRSTPQVIAAAEAVLRAGGIGVAGEPPLGHDGPPVRIHAFADDVEEAAGVVRLLRDAREHRRWSACAVLVRTHAQVAPIEHALQAAGVPTRTRTSAGLLDDPVARAALHDATGYPEPGGLRAWIGDLLAGTVDDDGEARPPDATLAQLALAADEFLASAPDGNVAALRTWLAMGGDEPGGREAVDVVTFHAAKGLEWPVVVVAGMESGLVPHAGATGSAGRAEELRLAYVALSRATERLHLTWSARRGGRERAASPWLAAVASTVTEPITAPPPPELRGARHDEGDPVLISLRRWRHAAARAARLPEQMVCADDTLAAIAAARPTSIDDLTVVPGVGRLAANRLGPRLLAAVAARSDAGA